MEIQAYRRDKPYTYELPYATLKFVPNDLGHVVCDVNDERAAAHLLAITTGFRRYGKEDDAPSTLLTLPPVAVPPQAPPTPQPPVAIPPQAPGHPEAVPPLAPPHPQPPVAIPPPAPASRYVISDGNVSLDLRAMDDKELRAFAKANGLAAAKGVVGDALRDSIVEHLSAAPANA